MDWISDNNEWLTEKSFTEKSVWVREYNNPDMKWSFLSINLMEKYSISNDTWERFDSQLWEI